MLSAQLSWPLPRQNKLLSALQVGFLFFFFHHFYFTCKPLSINISGTKCMNKL